MTHKNGTFAIQKMIKQIEDDQNSLAIIINTIKNHLQEVTQYPCLGLVLKRIFEVVPVGIIAEIHEFMLKNEKIYFKLMQGKHTMPILKKIMLRFFEAQLFQDFTKMVKKIYAGYSNCSLKLTTTI